QKRPIHEMQPQEVRSALEQVLRLLQDYAQPSSYLPYQHIHFQRQTDFVYDEGQRLVERLYTTTQIDRMLSDIGARTGANLAQSEGATAPKANETRFYRNAWMRALVEPAKPALKGLLSPQRWAALKQATRNWVFVSSDRKLQAIFDSDYIRDFIMDYYRDDLRLFEALCEIEQRPAAEGPPGSQKSADVKS
ncbi:hypothetical protein, partial [Chromohalobacter sp. 296-RDG]|uniref:hypothetical protein n=1 Tax=Chromohalobacter sp. 296-RDG TaxID=2994062 RepID=UPI0024697ECC